MHVATIDSRTMFTCELPCTRGVNKRLTVVREGFPEELGSPLREAASILYILQTPREFLPTEFA